VVLLPLILPQAPHDREIEETPDKPFRDIGEELARKLPYKK